LREVKDAGVNKKVYMKKCNIYFLQKTSDVQPMIQNDLANKTKELGKLKEKQSKEFKQQQQQQQNKSTTLNNNINITTTNNNNNIKQQFTPNVPKTSRFKQQRNQDQ